MGGNQSLRYHHEPVMAAEVIRLLAPVPAGLVVDCTVGGGGHSHLILEARPDVRLLGIDRDPAAVAAATERLAPFGDRARIVQGGFEDISDICAAIVDDSEGIAMGVLFDLGVSSPQLDRADRGFSYWGEAPLDMRMDSAQALTAARVVNEYPQEQLAELIATNGEERHASRIAASIVARRPLQTTADLVDAVKAAIPARARRRGGHPARRTFQAVRMEVNRELPNLADGLDESVHLLAPGGRVLVLAYHSLEDRLVKQRFADLSGANAEEPHGFPVPIEHPPAPLEVLTRRPLRPTADEITRNPRAESAKLRAAERLPSP